MDIYDEKTAREFVSAWTGHSGARWHLTHAAESQRSLAQPVLEPADVVEYVDEFFKDPEDDCTCRPHIRAGGGFSSRCRVHA